MNTFILNYTLNQIDFSNRMLLSEFITLLKKNYIYLITTTILLENLKLILE